MRSVLIRGLSRRGCGQELKAEDPTLPSRNTSWRGAELNQLGQNLGVLIQHSSEYTGEFIFHCHVTKWKGKKLLCLSFLKGVATKHVRKPSLLQVVFGLGGIRGSGVWLRRGERELWWQCERWQPSLLEPVSGMWGERSTSEPSSYRTAAFFACVLLGSNWYEF